MLGFLKALGKDAFFLVLSPFILVFLTCMLPYLLYIWIKGLIDTAKGHKPEYSTEFDTPREDKPVVDPNAPRPSLEAYRVQTTINNNVTNNTYNVESSVDNSVDNSSHVINSTDSHNQVVNNYFYQTPAKPEPEPELEPQMTFTATPVEPKHLKQPESQTLPGSPLQIEQSPAQALPDSQNSSNHSSDSDQEDWNR